MLLLVTDPLAASHDPGPGHPEAPQRLNAVLSVMTDERIADAIVSAAPRRVTDEQLSAVHERSMIDRALALTGVDSRLDADTIVCPATIDIALSAAGAGLVAVDALRAGLVDSAFSAIRPPGHHATASTSMGFCVFNSVAVTAAALVAGGERVLIADFDAHHGNGTQDIFYANPSVLTVSWHQSPLYPGTGAATEVGTGPGTGTAVNVPMRAGTTGDCHRRSLDGRIGEIIEQFAPTWLLISAGFDAHRDDPITDLGLTAGDFAALTADLHARVPRGRTIAFLEGGYHLEALQQCTLGCVAALIGRPIVTEPESFGRCDFDALAAMERAHRS